MLEVWRRSQNIGSIGNMVQLEAAASKMSRGGCCWGCWCSAGRLGGGCAAEDMGRGGGASTAVTARAAVVWVCEEL